MVSEIKALKSAVLSQKQEKIKNIVKYVNGETIKEVPDTFTSSIKDTGTSIAFFEGMPLINFFRRNKILNKANNTYVSDAMNCLQKMNKASLTNLIKGSDKLSTRISDFIKSSNKSKNLFSDLKSIAKHEAKSIKFAEKAKIAAEKAPDSIKAVRFTNKAGKEASKAISEKVAAQTAKQSTKALGKLSKLGKFKQMLKSSGAGVMLAISGILELGTEVVPTFKELGFKKGIKQILKSAIKVSGDTFGFIAGEHIGTALGIAIGTAIFPGAGTILGGILGLGVGLLGSSLMGKVTKKITGKSEREKAKEEQENIQAQQLETDSTSLNSLIQQAEAKLQTEELQTGKLSDDAKIIMDDINTLNNPEENLNPFAA